MARTKRGVILSQLAERHGWNLRTTYRDIETLREAGVPVDHSEHGRFSVPDHWLPSGTVDVKREELLALFVARHLAPGLKDTSVGHALDGLWSKLSTPGRQTALPLGDEAWISTRRLASIDYGPHRVLLDNVRDAIRQRRALHIHYRKPDGRESHRTIEPAVVWWDAANEALYLPAWCQERGDVRVFAIHRIQSARLTDEPFVPRREAVAEMNKAYRLWPRSKVERVSLWFSPRVAGEVRERRWHPTERMTDTPDGGVVLEMDIAAPEELELERELLGYGADVHVEEPASLAERIRERHAEAIGPDRFGVIRASRASQADRGAVTARQSRSKL